MRSHSLCNDLIQQPLAARQHIPPGGIEIVGVPGVRYLLLQAARVFHQQVHLVVEVAAADAVHAAEVCPVHPNEQVVFLVVAVAELPGGMAAAGDTVFRQLPPGRRVDRVADLLPAGGRRGNLKLVLQARLLHQVPCTDGPSRR